MQLPTTLDSIRDHFRALQRGISTRESDGGDDLPRLRLLNKLTLGRSIAVLAGLCLAYVGFEDARLRVHCGGLVELEANAFAETTGSDPLWVKLRGVAPPVNVAISSSDSGNNKGAWIPLVSPEEPGTAVAIVSVEDRDDAWALQSRKGPVTVEGLAYSPRRGEMGNISSYLSRLKLREAPGLRVLEVGRRPSSLAVAVLFIALGVVLVIAALRHSAVLSLPATCANHTIPAYVSEPLSDEIKVEVRHMLDQVWAETLQK